MKIKGTKNNKKGISLIVLVITIIVIIILALAVILSINKNNPIENAKVAKEKNNEKVYQEEIELYVANELVNNHEFNKDTLNSINIKNVVDSILSEDEEKYIIWQGKLAKKDGEVYKYIKNNEEIKTFDDESVTKEMLEFLKEFESIQKERKEAGESTFLYNGGYIANITPRVTKVEDFKNMFEHPNLIEIKLKDGTTSTELYFNTDDQILYDGHLVSRVIIYGDTNCDSGISANDDRGVVWLLNGSSDNLSVGQIISCDVNHNGIIDKEDKELIGIYSVTNKGINQNISPIVPKY